MNSGKVDFSNKFANTISIAKKLNPSNSLTIEIFVDKTSIEIFYNNGETVMTELFFLNKPFETLSVMSSDKQFVLKNVKIEELKPIKNG